MNERLTPEDLRQRQEKNGCVTYDELMNTEFPPDPIVVAYDPVVKVITFHERLTGHFIYDWGTERDNFTKRRIVDLFLALGEKTWASQRLIHDTALLIIQNGLV